MTLTEAAATALAVDQEIPHELTIVEVANQDQR
jgi:hypothetical protein